MSESLFVSAVVPKTLDAKERGTVAACFDSSHSGWAALGGLGIWYHYTVISENQINERISHENEGEGQG